MGEDSRRFRTESFSGSGARRAEQVMAYEIYELGNTDILEWLLSQDGVLVSPNLRSEIEDIVRELEEEGYICDWTINDAEDFAERILDEIASTTGVSVIYALWLAAADVVASYYGGSPSDIEEYPPGNIVLSDLGADGILYGYRDDPLPL